MSNLQSDFLDALKALAPAGVTPRQQAAFANAGVIYFQDDNFQTILGVSYDFQTGSASFNLTEITDAEKSAIGTHHTASRPQDMTWDGWHVQYVTGGLKQVLDGVQYLLNHRVTV